MACAARHWAALVFAPALTAAHLETCDFRLSLVQRHAQVSRGASRAALQPSTLVHRSADNVSTCDSYMSGERCGWTDTYPCPGQPVGGNFSRAAVNDGSEDYQCCCERELWKSSAADQIAAEQCAAYVHQKGCEWTEKYPCPGQYRGPDFLRDAQSSDAGHKCCCEMEHWRTAMTKRIQRVERLSRMANTCDAYVTSKGCSWTSRYPCPGQPWTTNSSHTAEDDESVGFQCCCDMQMWKTERAVRSVAECKMHLSEAGCGWTTSYPCAKQPRTASYVHDAVDDGTVAFDCCCKQEGWKQGDNDLMFIHIPKNAGTAIEEVSAQHKIWWPRKWLSFWRGVKMPDGSSCEKYHVPPQYLRALGEPDNDMEVFKKQGTFCVTRHPYERAVSEYLYMLQKPWGPAMSNQYYTGLLAHPRCTREGLNSFLQDALTRVQEGRKFLHDCHFIPQVEYVWGADGYQWCKHVIRQEELPHAFNDLMERHNYEPRMEELKLNNSTTTCSGITVDSLDWRTKRLLDDIYRDDFSRLNYTRSP